MQWVCYVKQLCTCITLFCTFLCRHCTSVKMPDFTLFGGRKQATTNLSFSFLNLSAVPKKSTLGKLAYIWHFQRIGINATKVFKVTFSLPSPSSMLKFSILASWMHSKLSKCSYLGIRTLWANCFMTFLMRSMRQIIIAHAQSSIRQCPREMGAYQLHKPPWWKVFSPAASTLESEKTLRTRLVEIL